MEGLEAARHSGQSHGLSLGPTPASQAVGRAEGLVPGRLPCLCPRGPEPSFLKAPCKLTDQQTREACFFPLPLQWAGDWPGAFLKVTLTGPWLSPPQRPSSGAFLLSSHRLPSHSTELPALPYFLLSASEEGAIAELFSDGAFPWLGSSINPKRTPLCLPSP